MSGTGTIHDFTSEHRDIEIDLSSHYVCAIIIPAYYNSAPSRHRTLIAGCRVAIKLNRQGYKTRICNKMGAWGTIENHFSGKAIIHWDNDIVTHIDL